ncbi:MAG: ATP-binding protein [Defluviicoccus sp.]|nr:ATP-binding protein [Defluviicoccus sp.]MDE0383390.1 ATP-binding protein [Defluviicoccus sp.]
MRLAPSSLAGQFALLLLLAVVVAQGIAIALFAAERSESVQHAHRENVIARAGTVARLLREAPPDLHEAILAAASNDEARLTLAPAPLVDAAGSGERAVSIARDLSVALGVAEERVKVAPMAFALLFDLDHEDDHDHGEGHEGSHWFAASAKLPDEQWLNVAVGPPPAVPAWGWTFLLSLLLSALAVTAVAVLLGRRIQKPMRNLAAAAGRLGRGEEMDALPETGPTEIRGTVRAFNRMRDRLDRYMQDRMAMLAAISHDLRTPITSLRLRAELVEDGDSRTKMLGTLDEMQRMTENALGFIRENMEREETRTVDLHALIDSVAVDLADLGHELTVRDTGRVLLACRPIAMRRAFRNLLENASIHGSRATVRIAQDDAGLCVVIEDQGPGIPEADRERVFEPFVRLDESRSLDKGGAGLGLAIARTIVRGHGGNISLENRDEGGLRATVMLPGGDGS